MKGGPLTLTYSTYLQTAASNVRVSVKVVKAGTTCLFPQASDEWATRSTLSWCGLPFLPAPVLLCCAAAT